jgi:hypothetical protein
VLGVVVQCVTLAIGAMHEVARPNAHSGPVGFRVGAEDQARVVRHVEPLVRVGGPGVSLLHAGYQRPKSRTGGSPQPEGAIDVDPYIAFVRQVTDLADLVDGSGVDIAHLGTNDRRCP